MGTKVDSKSYLPRFFSMRDLNEDSSSGSWPLFYRDNNKKQNGQYHNGSLSFYPGHNKDTLKQKMLEHEAVFKNQVCELHRLYGIQRDMMQEVKRKEIQKHRASVEPASSTSLQGSQVPFEDARKWHMAGFPLSSPRKNRTFSGVEIVGNSNSTTKESEMFDPRPLKVRKKSFDLQLPADRYIDTEETEDRYIGLADLNEPVRIEEGISPSCVDFLGSTSEEVITKCRDRSANSKSGFFGVTRETVNARNGFLTNSSAGSKVCERGKMSYIHEGVSTSVNLSSVTQILPPVIYPTVYNGREDMWRERLRSGLESSDRTWNHSNNSHLGPIEASGSYPFLNNYSCFATSWAKSTNNFAQKVTTLETLSTNRNHHQQFSSKLNPGGFGSESTSNGFYHASASGSKELLQKGTRFRNGSILANSKPVIEINLNEEAFPKSLSNEIEIVQDLNTTDAKSNPEDHLLRLPWLKPWKLEPSVKSSNLCASSDRFSSKTETSDCEIAETRTDKKILGFPVFGRDARADELAPLASTSAKPERKNTMIDINVACEPDDELIAAVELISMEKEKPKNGASIRDHIDLNSCLSDCEEEEEPPSPDYEKRKSSKVKITLEIDLEVPFLIESEDDGGSTLSKENTPDKESLKPIVEHKNEQIRDEILTTAAETIIAISSYCPQIHTTSEASLAEALLWLADSLSSSQMDDFEAMTLQIAETREEDYLPKPFVLENVEEMGPIALPMRSRRGNARRGRQKRDFQRDILPGLVSLSRHEVTEDIQIFGGLMRATGYIWNSGSTRRNGAAARGRKRAVIETAPSPPPVVVTPLVNCIEAGLEDRSLSGWGKTTRRPRRQRCPTGNNNNSPTVALA